MYYITKNNVITLTRGDFIRFPINLRRGEFPNFEIYELEDGDVCYFGLMMNNQHFENACLKLEFTKIDQDEEGNIYITINPEDTIALEPGTYYYEVKVLYQLGNEQDVRIDTVVQKTKFIIVD